MIDNTVSLRCFCSWPQTKLQSIFFPDVIKLSKLTTTNVPPPFLRPPHRFRPASSPARATKYLYNVYWTLPQDTFPFKQTKKTMRLHSWVEDPPRMVFVLRDVRDTLHFLVPCGVKVGIELVRILGCREFRHCSQVKRNKKRGEIFWAEEKLRGGRKFSTNLFL